MMNEKTVTITNTGNHNIGFSDMQGRKYIIKKDAKIRVSRMVLQDLLDQPGNKVIFVEGLAKVEGVDLELLLDSGLTEQEAYMIINDPLEDMLAKKRAAKKASTTDKTKTEKKPTASKTTRSKKSTSQTDNTDEE